MGNQRACLTFDFDDSTIPINFSALENHNPVFYLGSDSSDSNKLLAIGSISQIESNSADAFDALKTYRATIQDWCFGWMNYDLKNNLEELSSENDIQFNNSKLVFVQPELIFEIISTDDSNKISCLYYPDLTKKETIEKIVTDLFNSKTNESKIESITFKPSLSKNQYLNQVREVKSHIQRGDIYEANFCQQFTAKSKTNPYAAYQRLNKSSPTPHTAFVKYDEFYTLCASPERFLKKVGSKITTEPIKGTISRSANPKEDLALIEKLKFSQKDRTENVMIVDLARNDLSKIAKKGSVIVEELFGIYTFPQVHQMISRVVCEVENDIDAVEIIKALFPIASMTGVPKISALKIIDELENFQRELYSGCIGHFTPENDFDFNVVIRSMFYNSKTEMASYAVGGAIIAASNPEEEYEETLLKAKAITSLFN